MLVAIISPGVRPGRSAIEKAIKPASTGTISAKALLPPICISATARGSRLFERSDTKGEGECDAQAPCDHHRQHVGNTGQQMTVSARFFLLIAL